MFTGLTDQQAYILYGIAIFLAVSPVVIGAAAIAGILGRMSANHTDAPHPGQPV